MAQALHTKTINLTDADNGTDLTLTVEYGIREFAADKPYFSVTGQLVDNTCQQGFVTGPLHEIITEALPELGLLTTLHLCNANTGEPLHALANSWYFYNNPEEGPARYRGLTSAQRAAEYLKVDPAIFVGADLPEVFAARIAALAPLWQAKATLARNLYDLPSLPTPVAPFAITLDAAAVRTEIFDGFTHGGNPLELTQEQVTALGKLDNEIIAQTIDDTVEDHFWEVYDSTRNDVIRALLTELETSHDD